MRTLLIGDTHLPDVHPQYLRFCRDMQDKHRCGSVVHMGDVVDHHSISFHAKHPEMPGPDDECEAAFQAMRPWVKTFPKMHVAVGNHDRRVIRLAEDRNIPKRFLRDFAKVWETPGWKWVEDIIIDDCHISHGEGCAGAHPAYWQAQKMLMSVAIGHCHTAGGVCWLTSPTKRIFGLDVGCGIDEKSLAFSYGKHFKRRGVLSCAVLIDGTPYHEIMPCGPGEKYARRR